MRRRRRLVRITLTHLLSNELPPSMPVPWRDTYPPDALIPLLSGRCSSVHIDACACVGLLALASEAHVASFVSEGAVEALLHRLPPLPPPPPSAATPATPAATHIYPRRSLPPWRVDEATAADRREELRLQVRTRARSKRAHAFEARARTPCRRRRPLAVARCTARLQ
jgi:hypothetical protein